MGANFDLSHVRAARALLEPLYPFGVLDTVIIEVAEGLASAEQRGVTRAVDAMRAGADRFRERAKVLEGEERYTLARDRQHIAELLDDAACRIARGEDTIGVLNARGGANGNG